MSAGMPAPTLERVQMKDAVQTVHAVNTASKSRRVAPGISESNKEGLKKLRILDPTTSKINVQKQRSAGKMKAAPEGATFFESFEGWNGTDSEWVPEGWTVEMKGEVSRDLSWTPSAWTSYYYPAPADGDYYYGVSYSYENPQDEWLISPEIPVGENNVLTYWLYLSPAYIYSMDNVNWDTLQFEGDRQIAANVQVLAQVDGGEWAVIMDYAEYYNQYTLEELLYMEPEGLTKQSVSLADYAGKEVKFAFRYYGLDGNTVYLDAIAVGLPELDGISYMNPFESLYWGFERDWYLSFVGLDIAQYPVFSPLTWNNYSDVYDCDFTWGYTDPVTRDWAEDSTDPWSLALTYEPDYTDAATKRNNFFLPPVLSASAPGAGSGSYQSPVALMQAGGKAEYKMAGGDFNANLLPFAVASDGVARVTVSDDDMGALSIPVFGYNQFVDQYWLNYSLNGAPAAEGDYSHLEAIANLFMAPAEAPLVVNGITVYGYGNIGADVELTATIYALDESMSADFEALEAVATATCKGSDLNAEYEDDSNGYICIPFDFEQPVALQSSAEHPAFLIMFSGFRNEGVKYFAPLQSAIPDPNYLCLGYILNHIDLSASGRPAYYSLKPMVYKADGEYVDPYASFAIALEAEYPWLTCDTEEVVFDDDTEVVPVPLGSYYDGSKLSVETPEGINASATGRYDECVLTVTCTTADAKDGNIVVKAPGVEVTIPVKVTKSGISSIDASVAGPATIYDLSGRRVDADAPGVYIIRNADGTVAKRIVK